MMRESIEIDSIRERGHIYVACMCECLISNAHYYYAGGDSFGVFISAFQRHDPSKTDVESNAPLKKIKGIEKMDFLSFFIVDQSIMSIPYNTPVSIVRVFTFYLLTFSSANPIQPCFEYKDRVFPPVP